MVIPPLRQMEFHWRQTQNNPRNCITWTDAEPQGSPLGLTSLDPPPTHLPLEVRNQLAAEIGCYICMEQHWKGTQGMIHQKSSQLFGDCRSRVRFRNPQSHPCFEQERDLMRTGCQSFSSSLPPFCPILHSVSQAQPQPLVPPSSISP